MGAAALLCLAPLVSYGQNKEARQARRKISEVLTEFGEENQGYQRELKYFGRVAASRPLAEIHAKLVGQAAQMRRLEAAGPGSGPAVLELAREMTRTAGQLDVATTRFEKRAEAVSSRQDREVAERMKHHSDRMVTVLKELIAMFR
jgi:hypothetical protein